MDIEIVKVSDQIVSNWSGGSTTQLYISPKDSVLQERNFDFRISSARVEVEESDFTEFIGFDRYLMVLEGEVEIFHEGHHSKILKQFEIDQFSGDWKTSSKGKIVDFNLILKRGIKGSLRYISKNDLGRDRSRPVRTLMGSAHKGYYVISGKMEIIVNQDNYLVSEGELIMMDETDEIIEIKGDCDVVEILIFDV
jgi:environmental stress-induced protein Ves